VPTASGRSWKASLLVLLVTVVAGLLAGNDACAQSSPSTFSLKNGMQVVVVEDHRVPVVTHMVWYRTGGGEDPWGRSGIAHFLEHLMFKSTGKMKSGEFSRIITRLGGRDNALTAHDTTSYFQRVAKENLRAVMELEADRMVNLRLNEDEVRTERDVIQEERRSSIDANPLSLLSEQMLAALYVNHPYGRPVIGWAHEMAKLTRQDAATFYKRYYAPNNAVLIVAGDVTVNELRPLAEATYGRNKPNPALTPRMRPQEPKPNAARRVRLEDARAGTPILLRYYSVPSYASAQQGEAEAIELLAWIVGGDETSRLYRRLVAEQLASTAGGEYQGNGLDSGRIAYLAIPVGGVTLEKVEAVLDAVIAEVREKGVTPQELDRAKAAAEAKRVFESDNQMTLARRYGEGLTFGRTIADIDAIPGRIQSRTLEDIKRAAGEFFSPERSATGQLIAPATPAAPPAATAKQ
jgi:zinc protease